MLWLVLCAMHCAVITSRLAVLSYNLGAIGIFGAGMEGFEFV